MNKVTYITQDQMDTNQAKALKDTQTREADQLKKAQRRDAIDLVIDQHGICLSDFFHPY